MINRLLPTMLNGILYWPFVNALNFKFVALEVDACVKAFFLGGDVCVFFIIP